MAARRNADVETRRRTIGAFMHFTKRAGFGTALGDTKSPGRCAVDLVAKPD